MRWLTESKYTPPQVVEYLQYINLRRAPSIGTVEKRFFNASYRNLKTIFFLHRLKFPFENTAIYFSKGHVDVSPQAIFDQLVAEGTGHGSHCCGLNILLLHILVGLGYRAFAGLGRLNKAPSNSNEVQLGTRTHMFLIVQTMSSPEVYLVDAGGGASGLIQPVPLRHGAVVHGACAPEEHRLVKVGYPSAFADATSRVTDVQQQVVCHKDYPPSDHWHLEIRCGSYLPNWRSIYSFFLDPVDFDGIVEANATVTDAVNDAGFRDKLFFVSYFRLDEWYRRLIPSAYMSGGLGRLVLSGGKISERIGETSRTVTTFKTETERNDALKLYFSVTIKDDMTV